MVVRAKVYVRRKEERGKYYSFGAPERKIEEERKLFQILKKKEKLAVMGLSKPAFPVLLLTTDTYF